MKPMAALLIAAARAVAMPAEAQTHGDHAAHMSDGAGDAPTLPGNDVFGAISEIVALLAADPATAVNSLWQGNRPAGATVP